jgi:type III secretory pathway component EscR
MERDPFLEKLYESPDRVAKLHMLFTIGYIIFITFVVIGLIAVILFYMDII